MNVREFQIEKKNHDMVYNLITEYDEKSKLEYLNLESLSRDIFDDDYPINAYLQNTKVFMLDVNIKNETEYYINNQQVTLSDYLKVIVKELSNKELLLETSYLKNNKQVLKDFLFDDKKLNDSSINPNIKPQYFYEILQGYSEDEYRRHFNRLFFISNKSYTQNEMFDIACEYADDEWAKYDKNGNVTNHPWYLPPRTEPIIINDVSLEYVVKNLNNETVCLDMDNKMQKISQSQVALYGKVSKKKIDLYKAYLLLNEVKKRKLQDEILEQFLIG